MKKAIKTLVVAGFSIIACSAGAQKLAHINFDSLVRAMPEEDSAKKIGQAHYQLLESEMEAMQKEAQEKADDYRKNQATYTELLKETKQQEIQDMAQRIQAFQTSAQTDLQHFSDSLTRPIIAKAKNAVSEVAKEHHYNYVFDTSSGVVLYFENSDDIYALVAEKLGLKPAAKK